MIQSGADTRAVNARTNKKIAIVGFASSSRDQAPFGDASWDIATLNHAHQWISRWDIWYEMHPLAHIRSDIPRDGKMISGNDHYNWLVSQPGPDDPKFKPIYMQEHFDEIPASIKYPIAEVNDWLEAKFGSERDYYTSSISQMLALAMWQGYEEIGLYGIDLLNEDEYAYQRAGCEYLIGLARGSGIKVHVPKTSALCKANYIYGYSEPPEQQMAGARVKHAESIRAQLESDKAAVIPHFHTFDGCLQALKLARESAAKANDSLIAELDKQLADISEKRATHLMNLKIVEGASNVAQSFVSWLTHEGRGGVLGGRNG